jgi:signal transduction histidine kinase
MYSGFTSIRRRCCITVLMLSGCFWCSITQGAEETEASWRVVILHSSDIALPASVLLEQTARKTLLAGTTRRIEFYTESLDGLRLPNSEYESTFVEFLLKKYKDRKPDIIIAVVPLALGFVQQHRLELWPAIPVVFCAIPDEIIHNRILGSGFTGVCLEYDFAGTIDLAIKLQSNARRLVLVTGVGDADKLWFQKVEQVFARYPRLQTVVLTNRSVPELIEAVRRLPRDSIVFYVSVYRDTTGQVFVPREVLKQLSQISGAPIYSVVDTYLGYGIVGGVISSWETQGRRVAQIALRVLAGEKPEAIPIEPSPPTEPMVDWRELKRWGLSENLLPPGTIVLFRQPSFWESYRWYIVAAGAAVAAQSALIIALLSQRARRRRAEIVAQQQQMDLAHASRLTMVGELTASITHEINQPLGAILSNAETAEILLQSKQPRLEEVQQILADIRKDDLRASEVIRRMRELLRKRALELKPIDLNAIISAVLRLVAGEMHRRGVQIEKHLADTLPVVRGDVIHLQQVLLNLILNGMEAMSESAESNRRLTMRTAYDGKGNVEVAVEDSGHGIPPERLPRLFNSFFTTKTHGMGLGLSIVRSIVEAHGGRIWAENNSSGGACFRFTLPVSGKE